MARKRSAAVIVENIMAAKNASDPKFYEINPELKVESVEGFDRGELAGFERVGWRWIRPMEARCLPPGTESARVWTLPGSGRILLDNGSLTVGFDRGLTPEWIRQTLMQSGAEPLEEHSLFWRARSMCRPWDTDAVVRGLESLKGMVTFAEIEFIERISQR